MRITGALCPAAAVLLLAACADRAGGPPQAPPSTASLPRNGDALVLQAVFTGGFVPPEMSVGRLPLASAYADGRVFLEGPVDASYPGPAWPNVQVVDIGSDGVQELAERALVAGIADTDDLGMPPIADAPSTRFTLMTAEETYVREAYALMETGGMPGSGLTDAQLAARQELQDLLASLTDLGLSEAGGVPPDSYTPAAVAGIVRPWTAPEHDVSQGLTPAPVPWPGPALPGEPVGPSPGLSCVTASGDEAAAVIDAARDASVLTSWQSPDGARWSVLFRPLLPHESGCADLRD